MNQVTRRFQQRSGIGPFQGISCIESFPAGTPKGTAVHHCPRILPWPIGAIGSDGEKADILPPLDHPGHRQGQMLIAPAPARIIR